MRITDKQRNLFASQKLNGFVLFSFFLFYFLSVYLSTGTGLSQRSPNSTQSVQFSRQDLTILVDEIEYFDVLILYVYTYNISHIIIIFKFTIPWLTTSLIAGPPLKFRWTHSSIWSHNMQTLLMLIQKLLNLNRVTAIRHTGLVF